MMKQELGTSDPKHVHTLGLPNHESSGWCQIPPSSRLSSVLLASVKYLASSHPNPSCFSIINRKRKTAEDICKCSMFLTDWLGFWTAFSSTSWVMSGGSMHASEEFSKQARWCLSALFSFCFWYEMELREFHFRCCWELWVSDFHKEKPSVQSSGPRRTLILWSPATSWFPKSRCSSSKRFPGPQLVANEGGALKPLPGPPALWWLLPALLSGGRKP